VLADGASGGSPRPGASPAFILSMRAGCRPQCRDAERDSPRSTVRTASAGNVIATRTTSLLNQNEDGGRPMQAAPSGSRLRPRRVVVRAATNAQRPFTAIGRLQSSLTIPEFLVWTMRAAVCLRPELPKSATTPLANRQASFSDQLDVSASLRTHFGSPGNRIAPAAISCGPRNRAASRW
jgi:hypothetical protein